MQLSISWAQFYENRGHINWSMSYKFHIKLTFAKIAAKSANQYYRISTQMQERLLKIPKILIFEKSRKLHMMAKKTLFRKAVYNFYQKFAEMKKI